MIQMGILDETSAKTESRIIVGRVIFEYEQCKGW